MLLADAGADHTANARILPGVRRAAWRVGAVLPALAACALWGWPLIGFLVTAFVPGLLHGRFAPGIGSFLQALHGGALQALRNSLVVALAAALLALPVGSWLAWLCMRTTLAWRGWIEPAVWLLLVMPGYFLASGWMLLAAPEGPLAHWPWIQDLAGHLLGPAGIILTLAIKALPYPFLATQAAFLSSSAAPLEAARVLGLPRWRQRQIAMALLLPALVAGFAAAFAESISDFSVAATLGAGSGTVLATYAIEQAVNAMPLNFALAAADSWLLLMLIVPVLSGQAWLARRATGHRSLGPRFRPPAPVRPQFTTSLMHALAASLLAALALGAPLVAAGSLALAGRAPSDLPNLLRAVMPSLRYSLELAMLSASVTVTLAWPIAAAVARRGRAGRLLDFALLAVMALPGIVLAAAYVLAYNQSYTPLYGGSGLLIMAYVALALPAATKVIQGSVARLHDRFAEAARVHGLSRLQTMWHVELPILARPLFSAWLLSVLHIAFELPASELLYPPGHPPLSVALLDSVSAIRLHQQARLQLSGMALLVVFALLARLVFSRLSARQVATIPPAVAA
ncbi:MAG: ABC transporter permease subunit [Pseudomonadota bacterium]|nr:ABC transporter permease subunit [Pseudomonadota bacterium]